MSARETQADITIAGLGILGVDQITAEAVRAFRASNEVLYVDTGVATRQFLERYCSKVTSLYETSYKESGQRLDAYQHMAARVVEAGLDHPPVTFAMPGHPIVGAYAPFLIRDMALALGLRIQVQPGISAMDCLFAELMIDPCIEGLQMVEATDMLLRRRPLQPDLPALLWQIGSVETRLHTMRKSRPERFERLRDYLLRFFPRDLSVVAAFMPPHPLMRPCKSWFRLRSLCDHAEALHTGYTLYIPAAFQRPVADYQLLREMDDPDHLRSITC